MNKLRSKFELRGIQFLVLEHPVGQAHDVDEYYSQFHHALRQDFSPIITITDMINYGFFITDNKAQDEVVDNINEHNISMLSEAAGPSLTTFAFELDELMHTQNMNANSEIEIFEDTRLINTPVWV